MLASKKLKIIVRWVLSLGIYAKLADLVLASYFSKYLHQAEKGKKKKKLFGLWENDLWRQVDLIV